MQEKQDLVDSRFQLLDVLGAGASSRVFTCKDLTDNKEYAIKMVSKTFLIFFRAMMARG